jgi:hypothetical protein
MPKPMNDPVYRFGKSEAMWMSVKAVAINATVDA